MISLCMGLNFLVNVLNSPSNILHVSCSAFVRVCIKCRPILFIGFFSALLTLKLNFMNILLIPIRRFSALSTCLLYCTSWSCAFCVFFGFSQGMNCCLSGFNSCSVAWVITYVLSFSIFYVYLFLSASKLPTYIFFLFLLLKQLQWSLSAVVFTFFGLSQEPNKPMLFLTFRLLIPQPYSH